MKKIFLLIIIFFVACAQDNLKDFDDYDDDCNYENCNTQEPFFTDLEIKFTRNAENPSPEIYLLLDKYEDNEIIDTINTDSISGDIAWINVAIGQYYTVYTVYHENNDTIVAIDGNFVLKETYTECDSLCWQVKNTVFNIKLKH